MVVINHKFKTVHLVKNDDNINLIKIDGYFGKTPLIIKGREKFKLLDLIEEETEILFFQKYFSNDKEEFEIISTYSAILRLEKGMFADFEAKYSSFDYSKSYSYESFMICLKSNQKFLKKVKPSRQDVENTFLFLN